MLDLNSIYFGDNLELLKQLPENSIDSCVSDFPYNLGFMGKQWDTISNFYDWNYQRAKELYRVLKPGGYCLVFGGTRTHHRMVCAFEDVGFQIKDEIMWVYSSGFPKSYNISKGFDKKAGVEREKFENPLAKKQTGQSAGKGLEGSKNDNNFVTPIPVTDLAIQWNGWGTALKPAHEPIMVAQKPIEKNYCFNVEKYSVGGLNIDDSRIPYQDKQDLETLTKKCTFTGKANTIGFGSDKTLYGKGILTVDDANKTVNTEGRFPANIIFDEIAGVMLDEQSGMSKSGKVKTPKLGYEGVSTTRFLRGVSTPDNQYNDTGGASRFFYCPKASTKDKTENKQIENNHPTVKPTNLIKYLIRLVTPKNGICLDICEGSGTHAKACLLLSKEGYPVDYIGFENDMESFNTANERIKVVTAILKE